MKRLLLLAPLLAACSPFNERFAPGESGRLEFQLSNGFWNDRFAPGTPIVAGGYTILEIRADDPARALVPASSDATVLEIPGEPLVPTRTQDGVVWKLPVRAGNPGRARVTLSDAAGPVDSVELEVASAGSLDWEIYDPNRQSRRDGDILLLHPDEKLEVSFWAYGPDGARFAGTDAWTLEAGAMKFLSAAEAVDETAPAAFEIEHVGARTPVRFTGKAFGSLEVIVRGRGGAPERRLTVKVDWAGE